MIRRPPREPRIAAMIDAGDVQGLLREVEYPPCACFGAENGEPLFPCRMTARTVRNMVSLAGLRNGKIVRVRPATQPGSQPGGGGE